MTGQDRELWAFHFQCPLCGSTPTEVLLREYLQEWAISEPERPSDLLDMLAGAIAQVRTGESRWLTKKFDGASRRIMNALTDLGAAFAFPLAPSERGLRFGATCPICLTPPGPREEGRYFTSWPRACKVQTGNLLYETGLALWAVLRALPPWASGLTLKRVNNLRVTLRAAAKAMSLMECPQCGRFTTCLYGHPEPKKRGFCRWCLDMGGGISPAIRLIFDGVGYASVKVEEPDATAPARNCWDILPPEVQKRIESMGCQAQRGGLRH